MYDNKRITLESTPRTEPCSYFLLADFSRHRVNYFQPKSRSVLDTSSVLVCAVVRDIFKELIHQIAICKVYFNAIETGFFNSI